MIGLQIFDANGNLTLDVTESAQVVIGEAHTGVSNGEIIDERITKDSFISVINFTLVKVTSGSSGRADRFPLFHIEDGRIWWEFKTNTRWATELWSCDVHFFYGGYPI